MSTRKILLQEGTIIKKVNVESPLFYNSLSYEGLCINRDYETPIFIYNLLPNEEADIKITYHSKKCCFAKVVKYRSFSPIRLMHDKTEEKLYLTGAAPLMSLRYENQLKFKQHIIKNLVERNLSFNNISPIISSNSEIGYRNKITVHIEYVNNKPILGFYKKYSHDLVEQSDLFLSVYAIREFYKNVLHNPIDEYSKKLNKAIFAFKPKQITLRAPKSSLSMLEVIIKSNLNNKKIIKNLEKVNKEKNIYKISLFINDEWINLLNHNGIHYEIGKHNFIIKNDAFYQINESIIGLIYKQILDWIPNSNLNILDAFSGVSTIGIYLSEIANKIYSVEINENATNLAKENILINKINNLEIINQDANTWMVENFDKVDIAVFDPPRTGLDKNTIDAIINSNIKTIIYLSCDPKTLIRDLKELTNNGYEIKEMKPYDMFPQTYHIETLVLIQKQNK